ncbi:GGDEF domain-containing protein [Aquincola sp. S2]|uniref:diguanylate cyclase n=1 Tax=Pseudaquabacterium terrae TaxID=2732868 RepID=A0ABX2EHM3_9BURK|nr:GGDEF domain-containing protein [Aquabacterium terrae]NRF68071.1 GGDEF domain-containing protein [Aquabacterium terrae]
MLGNVALTMLTLLLLQGGLAAGWLIAARALDLSRRSARHWSASALIGAAALALLLMRGWAPDWAAVVLGNTLSVVALLGIRRGLLHFLRQPLRDKECAAVVGLTLAAQLGCALLPEPFAGPARVMAVCVAMAWVLMRCALQSYPALKREFGERRAFLLVSPQVAGVALFLLRGLIGLVPGGPALHALPADTPLNIASALLILLLTLLLHGHLALMVLMRLVRRLRHLSQRDALTGLYNRAEWNRQLEAQHRWLGRFNEPFGVLMIDIDHFKKINDTMGHAAGDAVLLTAAQVLLASARDVDVVGRLGGEEFGVLLPRTEQMAVRRAAERLRQLLCDAETTWRGKQIKLTVSIGAALCNDADESPAHVLERADHALYQAKNTGRNRTVVARLAS